MRCFKQNWSSLLAFRNDGQGKRCKICARLDEEYLQCVTDDERRALVHKKNEHIAAIKAMRLVNVRGNQQSEADAQRLTDTGEGLVLKLMIDGMDQAKFRLPRNLVCTLFMFPLVPC